MRETTLSFAVACVVALALSLSVSLSLFISLCLSLSPLSLSLSLLQSFAMFAGCLCGVVGVLWGAVRVSCVLRALCARGKINGYRNKDAALIDVSDVEMYQI